MDRNDDHQRWLDQHREEILAPDLPIIDPHHHLWDDRPEIMPRYLLEDVLDDVDSGHNVLATVFLQCAAMYRTSGAEQLRPVGETEFVNGIAAMSAGGQFGPTRVAAGIVGWADLLLGAAVEEVLTEHIAVGGGRFRGVRFSTGTHSDPVIRKLIRRPQPENLLADPRLREAFGKLAPLGLSFDCWLYFHQLADVVDLANSFPGTSIILNHVGGILGLGEYEGRRDDVFAVWLRSIKELARCPNVTVKIGGLTMKTVGFGFHQRKQPPTSQELADAWRPYVEACVAAFGANRCMFESNFPVDKEGCSYPVLWNAFKRIAAGYSTDERRALFSETAQKVYRLS